MGVVRVSSALGPSLFVAVIGVLASCSSRENPAARGAQCYRLADCQEGLVCVKQVCTDKLEGIPGMYPPGTTGGAAGFSEQDREHYLRNLDEIR